MRPQPPVPPAAVAAAGQSLAGYPGSYALPPGDIHNAAVIAVRDAAPHIAADVPQAIRSAAAGRGNTMTTWRKSSHSFANSDCVEVCCQGVVRVRDSKLTLPDGRNVSPILEFSPAEWAAFTARVKAGGAM